MDKVMTYIKTRSVGYWLMAGAFVCGLVALIMYASVGTNENVPNLSGSVIASMVIFIVLAAAMLVYELRVAKYLTAAVGLFSLFMYVVVEIPYITQWITTTFMDYKDAFALHISVFVIIGFCAVAFGLAIASAAMAKSGLAREKKDKSKKKAAKAEAVESEEANA